MKRLDICVSQKAELFITSRTMAQELIKQGKITVNGKIVTKPSELISETDEIVLTGELPKYVGRGGFKLETAVDAFGIELQGCVCLDIGASTGGFTDCMLQNGAKKIYAVDVGSVQLHQKLKNDKRIISLEKLDIRNADENLIPEQADFIGIDVSFISLKLVLPKIKRFLKKNGSVVALIKPQFEAGKKYLKNGILKDKKKQEEIVCDIEQFVLSLVYSSPRIVMSKIPGGDGNQEYLIYFKN